jgi:hypothetical protein
MRGFRGNLKPLSLKTTYLLQKAENGFLMSLKMANKENPTRESLEGIARESKTATSLLAIVLENNSIPR